MIKSSSAILFLTTFCVAIGANSCRTKFSNGRYIRPEMEEVIEYYRHRGDSLGTESASFLVKGMTGQGTYDTNLGTMIPDEETVTKDYLIRSINSSLQSSRLSIGRGFLSKKDFLEYVLPYRLGSEPLTDWKSDCIREYPFLSSSTVSANQFDSLVIKKIQRINAGLIDHFTYQSNLPNADHLSWKQLMSLKSGDCVAMTNAITYPLRASGIPIAIDFTPAWGNANGSGHSWNALVTIDGASIPFLGFEGSPPQYSPFRIHQTLRRIPAKVFRKTYSKNINLLAMMVDSSTEIPRWLNFTRAIDVTKTYVKTDDVSIRLRSQSKAKITDGILYLSCFNKGKWTPVFWSEHHEQTYLFTSMATNVLYLPSIFNKKEGVVALEYPFVVTHRGVRVFKPDVEKRQEVIIDNTKSKESDALALFGLNISKPEFYKRIALVMSDKIRSVPTVGKTYSLYYWDGDWELVGVEKVPGNGKLVFRNVPRNAVYRLITAEKNWNEERVFSFSTRQEWW
jgi:hypothetical protein